MPQAESAKAVTDQAPAQRRDLVLDLAGQRLAVTLWVPKVPTASPCLFFCLPGGGMTRGYFDLRVPGNDSHSFAMAMAARGFSVAAMDHPGTGDSSGGADLYAHTPESLRDAAALACRQLREELGGGPLRIVGLGHSMGAMIVALAQAAHRCFDALALLGFSTRGLPQYVPADVQGLMDSGRTEVVARQVELARAMFAAMDSERDRQADRNQDLFGRGNAERDGVRALRDCAAPVLPVPAFRSMLPDNIAEEAASIAVPVFLGLGERDMAGAPHRAPAAFCGCSDLLLHILPGAGHSHFLFPARHALFARLDWWARGLPSGSLTPSDNSTGTTST